MGGMEAVIWTDVMQSVIMVGGIIFIGILLTKEVFSQPDYMIQHAFNAKKFSLGETSLSLSSRTIWVMIIYGVSENIRNLIADQNYTQKYCSVPDEKKAKRSVWIAMLIYLPLTALFLYIGTALFAFYSGPDHILGEAITKGDQVFPHFIATQLPVGLKGLIIAAILAASMSTIDSALNCSATVLFVDYYKKYFKPAATESNSVNFLRLTTVIWGIAGIAVALLLIKAQSALDIWWIIAGIFGGGILGLFLLGIFNVKITRVQGIASVIFSILIIVWGSFLRDLPDQFAWLECSIDPIIIGAISTLGLVLLALVFVMANKSKFMKQLLTILIAGLLSGLVLAQGPAKDPSKNPDPVVKAEFIFLSEDVPFPSCHASTIEETEHGLIAAWFAGTHEKNPDVGIWVSRSINGDWTDPLEVANGVQDSDKRYPCWNPVLFQPEEGPLMLFYKVGPSPQKWWGMLITSKDEGKTWSEPSKLGEGPFDHLLGPIKNKPVQLVDGTILCPSSSETRDKWRVHFELSRDMGQSWEVVGPINDGIEFDAIQPSVLFYPDEKMQVLCRTKQGIISQSWSSDGGLSWSPMEASMLPNPNSGTDAVTLKDGRQVLVYNHIIPSQTWDSRSKLNMAVSSDGIMWSAAALLESDPDPDSEYSYPAVIQTRDGMIHVTYTWNRKMIKHVVIDPSQIEPRPIVDGVWPEK